MSTHPTVRTTYLICSTPRSGSTLLCKTLTSTGIAGRPEEYYQRRRRTGFPRRPLEYFEDANFENVATEEIVEILGEATRVEDEISDYDPSRFTDYARYLAWTIEEGTTPNGVFGAKLMRGYFNGFVSHLRSLPGCAELSEQVLLPAVFPNLSFIWMTRSDKVRQAVSLWKALQTWNWSSDTPHRPRRGNAAPTTTPQYSSDAIDLLVANLVADDAAWIDYFAECRVEPFVVEYEHFAQHQAEVVDAIVDYLGIAHEGQMRISTPTLSRQSDEISDAWFDRYSAERRSRVEQL